MPYWKTTGGFGQIAKKNKQLSIHTNVKADSYEEKSAHLIYGNKLFLRKYINLK